MPKHTATDTENQTASTEKRTFHTDAGPRLGNSSAYDLLQNPDQYPSPQAMFDAARDRQLKGIADGYISAVKTALVSTFVSPDKGIDINRVSTALHAGGEALFALDANKDGNLTRGEVLDAGLAARDMFPDSKQLLNGTVLNSFIKLVPEKGLTKGEMVKQLHAIDDAMVKADKNHDGFLSKDEVKASPKLKELANKLQKELEPSTVTKPDNNLHTLKDTKPSDIQRIGGSDIRSVP